MKISSPGDAARPGLSGTHGQPEGRGVCTGEGARPSRRPDNYVALLEA